YMTGILAALGTAAATWARRRGAPGQEVLVTGLGAAFALNSGTYVTGPGDRGPLARNGDPRGAYPSYGLYATADGWICIGPLTPAFWGKLVPLVERVDLLVDPRLQGPPLTFGSRELRDFVRGQLEPILSTRTTAEWMRLLREADVPCSDVGTRDDFLRDPEA